MRGGRPECEDFVNPANVVYNITMWASPQRFGTHRGQCVANRRKALQLVNAVQSPAERGRETTV
jgi:hypothetical protein